METKESNKTLILIAISLLYLTLSLACDPLFFRQISLFGHTMSGSALIYSILYVLLDALTRIAGKKITIRLVLLFHFFDFLFTYILYLVDFLPAPADFKNLIVYQTLVTPMPLLFWSGVLGAIIAGIVDVLIFAYLQKRIKSFLAASFITTTIILFAHNIPTYYFTLRHISPEHYVEITIINTSIEALIAFFATTIAWMFFRKTRTNIF